MKPAEQLIVADMCLPGITRYVPRKLHVDRLDVTFCR